MVQRTYCVENRDSLEYTLQKIKNSREYKMAKSVLIMFMTHGVTQQETLYALNRVSEEIPKAKVMGMPKMTFDFEENRSEKKFAIYSCSFFMESEAHVLFFPTSLDFKKLGQRIGNELKEVTNLKGVGIFFAGSTLDLEDFLKEATQGNEEIPFFGVVAADQLLDQYQNRAETNIFHELACYAEKPYILANKRISTEGLVLTLFIGEDLHIQAEAIFNWQPIGRELKITEVENNRIVKSIDGMKPTQVYEKYLNVKPDSYFIFNICEFPMIFERNGLEMGRVPSMFDKEGNLFFGADVNEGEKFRFSYANAHDLLRDTWFASEDMRRFGPESVHLVICGNRQLFLKDNFHVEIDDFKRFEPETRVAMGAAEVYCYQGQGGVLNSTIVAVGIREGEPVKYPVTQCTLKDTLMSGRMIPLSERLATFLEVTTAELEEKAIEAKKASKAKSQFLSNMSHEIRTPINAILGMNEMILRESTDENIIEYAKNIQTASSTLLGLVNDILDFSKIEAGKMDIIEVEYDPSSMLNDLVNMIKTRAEKKGLDFYIICSPEIPSLLYGDEIRIKQVATNILTNAVKYTQAGHVLMTVGCRKIDENHIEFMFSIADTGIGIKEKDLEKLYSAFERIEEKRNRTIEGTGLGMNITHRLLELMGSDLKVESVYGVGSNFSFAVKQEVRKWIPIGDFQKAYHLMLQKHQIYHEKFVAPEAKILVVDDTPMNLTVVKGLLKQTKVQIDTAESGREALKLVTKNRYDLIFLDHRMPEMDGIETLENMQKLKDNLNKSVPVISLTANAISGAREIYIKAGFDDYLTKPIHSDQLEAMMIKYLPPEKIEESIDDSVETIDDSKIPDWLKNVPGLNIDLGIQNCGSIDGYIDALKIFYDSIKSNSDEIENLFKENDFLNYTVKVHALKSSAKVIGAEELSEKARRLEDAGNQNYVDEIKKDTPALLNLYRSYVEKLSALGEVKEDDSNLPEIDQSQLAEAFEAIKEMSASFDYDSVQFVFESLKEFKIPVKQKEQLEKIKVAAGKPDWEEVNNLLKAVVA